MYLVFYRTDYGKIHWSTQCGDVFNVVKLWHKTYIKMFLQVSWRPLMFSADLQIWFPGLPGFNSSTWHYLSCSWSNSQSASQLMCSQLNYFQGTATFMLIWIMTQMETCKRFVLAPPFFNYAPTIYLSQAVRGSFTLPYLMGKACYRLALRPPVGPMRIPELTFRLLKPLWVFSKLQEWAPMFLSYFTWK